MYLSREDKPKLVRDILIGRLYHELHFSIDAIQAIFSCSSHIVRRAVKRFEKEQKLEKELATQLDDEIRQFYGGINDGTAQ